MASDQLTSRGIAALRAGDRVRARRFLIAALRANPQDLQAWLWLSGTLPEPEAQRYCLQRVLALDPEHRAARRGLQALESRRTQQVAQAAARQQPVARELAPKVQPSAASAPVRQTVAMPSGAATRAAPMPTAPAATLERPAAVPLRPTHSQQPSRLATLAPPAPVPAALVAAPASAPACLPVQAEYANPWFTLWHQPRRAMRSAIAMRSTGETWLLAALAGVSGYLAAMAWSDLGASLGSREVLGVAIVIGPLLGMLGLQVGGVLLRTGGWLLGGRAAAGRVRAALAWATAPLILGLPLWLVQILFWPEATFQRPTNPFEQVVINGANLMHLGLWLWAAWLSLIGLAEAQLTGMLRALASWLATIFVIVLAFTFLFGGAALIIGWRGG
ncbi:Yip1 family protein [Candidatus Viridilinea mediisalina]|uniref:Yip1 domain-containing protein n=1 Tax=Candidatus Viridilinea mediisalina TaxID=2024553 RepID=A0A2A6RMM9_9CHLR|nr:Yip1 family protein [Candidatus Viridilinea mediisalina]PDW04344.1 hypothetical protein CJ255_04110 [Candidatus Viridilinea mediisalina]